MNNHLNIFKAYSKDNREYQLENDLTRAFAICLQEDNLFFHEVLKEIIRNTEYYNQFFGSYENDANIEIDIQKEADKINDFEHIFAISLSDNEMLPNHFWEQKNGNEYNPICDLVMKIDNVLFVIEAKRNNVDCTAQLYNQIFNISNLNNDFEFSKEKGTVTPFDLNWRKLMGIATRVYSFQKSTNQVNRFLSDFIDFVRIHNFTWLPESCLSSLSNVNHSAIYRRIKTAITQFAEQKSKISLLDKRDRLCISFPKSWAEEMIFSIRNREGQGDLVVSIYPGNTKGQGYGLFNKTPKFNKTISINGKNYAIEKYQHIKLASFQKYFAGLDFGDDNLKLGLDELYNSENFYKYTGRKKRESWGKIEKLFDKHFKYDWRNECGWKNILNSKRTQFDMSFGYAIEVIIPFKDLQELDKDPNDLSGLIKLISDIYDSLSNDLLIS